MLFFDFNKFKGVSHQQHCFKLYCSAVLFHKNTIQMINQQSSAKNKTQKTQKAINEEKDKERGNADARTCIILLEHTKVNLIFIHLYSIEKITLIMPLSLLYQFLFSLEAVLFFHQHFLRSFDSFAHPYTTLHILGWSNLLAEGEKNK